MQSNITYLLTFYNYLPCRLFIENILKVLVLLDFLVSEETLVNCDVKQLSAAVNSIGRNASLNIFPERAEEPNFAPFSRLRIKALSFAMREASTPPFSRAKWQSCVL